MPRLGNQGSWPDRVVRLDYAGSAFAGATRQPKCDKEYADPRCTTARLVIPRHGTNTFDEPRGMAASHAIAWASAYPGMEKGLEKYLHHAPRSRGGDSGSPCSDIHLCAGLRVGSRRSEVNLRLQSKPRCYVVSSRLSRYLRVVQPTPGLAMKIAGAMECGSVENSPLSPDRPPSPRSRRNTITTRQVGATPCSAGRAHWLLVLAKVQYSALVRPTKAHPESPDTTSWCSNSSPAL